MTSQRITLVALGRGGARGKDGVTATKIEAR